jgi:hypothetical protein
MMRSEAEIRETLESLRKQYDESVKNPIPTGQDRNAPGYFDRANKRRNQLADEIDWMGEIAILEWVLVEKQTWLTSWMRTRS